MRVARAEMAARMSGGSSTSASPPHERTQPRTSWSPATRADQTSAPSDSVSVSWLGCQRVSAARAVDGEVRLYETLFRDEDPGDVPEGSDELSALNPESLTVLRGCKLEPALTESRPGEALQLERLGYFCADPDGSAQRPVFNRTVTLRDTWARIAGRG